MALNGELSPAAAFWQAVTRLDRAKFNSNWMALRNAIATGLPLAVGIAIGNPLGAVAITTGALNVAYADGRDPYGQRMRRMLTWSCFGAFAVFLGSVTGSTAWASISVIAIWAFIAGMAISISSRAGDLGLNTLVALIVFGARGALSPKGALIAACLVLAGGLLQTAFALLFWAMRRYEPERNALGRIYTDLAKELDPVTGPPLSTPLTVAPSVQIQETVTALGREHSIEGERYRMLFDQAERIRMSVYVLTRLRTELRHSGRAQTESLWTADVERMLELSAKLLGTVGTCLLSGGCQREQSKLMAELHTLLETAQRHKIDDAAPLGSEVASAMDTLAGQLRAVVTLAAHATPDGLKNFAREERSLTWRFQIRSWIGTLRANLFPGSAAFRHAVRLAVCVTIADAIGRDISWQRSYWIPMTVAIVLKPDFTTTFSRGVLRLAGTLGGLALATVLYHAVPQSALTQLFLVGVFMFVLRRFGPANYGIFSIAISGLIVFLLGAIGVSPKEAVMLRGIDTTTGGIFALLAYALWPTWERTQVSDTIADLIDATRNYFRTVAESFAARKTLAETDADKERRAWRRARSNAEASVDRVNAEPGTAPEKQSCLVSILASLSAAAHAIMALEAGLVRSQPRSRPKQFEQFARDVEFTLYFLSQALHGSRAALEAFPKLREEHRRIFEARAEFGPQSEFVLIETDRLTVALNTLREQVIRYLGASA